MIGLIAISKMLLQLVALCALIQGTKQAQECVHTTPKLLVDVKDKFVEPFGSIDDGLKLRVAQQICQNLPNHNTEAMEFELGKNVEMFRREFGIVCEAILRQNSAQIDLKFLREAFMQWLHKNGPIDEIAAKMRAQIAQEGGKCDAKNDLPPILPQNVPMAKMEELFDQLMDGWTRMASELQQNERQPTQKGALRRRKRRHTGGFGTVLVVFLILLCCVHPVVALVVAALMLSALLDPNFRNPPPAY